MEKLGTVRKDYLSSAVTYHRGAQSVAIQAAIGRSDHQYMDNTGGAIAVESRDFIVTAADLIIGSVVVEPIVGDRIKQTIGSAVRVYAVAPPYQGERHFRPADQYGLSLRIHTKEVAVE